MAGSIVRLQFEGSQVCAAGTENISNHQTFCDLQEQRRLVDSDNLPDMRRIQAGVAE